METKRFDDREFRLEDRYQAYYKAKEDATRLRKQGYKVRLVREKSGLTALYKRRY